MKQLKYVAIIACALLLGTPILNARGSKNSAPQTIMVDLPSRANASQRYGNLDYSLRIQVNNDVRADRMVELSDLPSKEAASFPGVELDYSLTESTEQYLDNLASSLGFKVGGGSGASFVLRVTIKDFRLRVRDYNVKKKVFSSSGAMVIGWELLNPEGELALSSSTSTGRGTARSSERIANPLKESFVQALDGIDWDRIASQMKIAKTAKQEKNKEVEGMGNSALEHTVIRWNIVSRPQGADVYWRVVSSTPDVANTNSNYVGTTPYESTEAFDIRGLSYNNSGNVQIEVSCEKPGYVTQRKRFNLRQAIDQKEISAKFNLVKEDDEE